MLEHPYDDDHEDSYDPPPAPRRVGRKLWLAMAGLALLVAAAMLAMTLMLPALAAGPAGAANVASGQGIVLVHSRAMYTRSAGASWAGVVTLGDRGFGLTVTGVSGSTITATTRGGTPVTIQTTSSTSYSRADQTVSASAITKGERIGVRGMRKSDNTITASRITILLPLAAGKITAIGSGSITVTGRGGATVTITTPSSTKYLSISSRSGSPVQATIARGSLKVGDVIAAEGTQAGTNSLSAVTIAVVPAGLRAAGHARWNAVPSATASTGV